jgi:hypothetical protein
MNSTRFFWGIAGFCLIAASAFAQGGFAGKWQTDQAAQAALAGRERSGEAIVMELNIDGDRLSGTIQEIGVGKPLTIMEGTLGAGMFSFKTVPPPGPDSRSTITWTGRMLDDNTISVTRSSVTTYRAVARTGGGFRGGVPVDPPRGRNDRDLATLTLRRAR